jgi:hypothetical protein
MILGLGISSTWFLDWMYNITDKKCSLVLNYDID